MYAQRITPACAGKSDPVVGTWSHTNGSPPRVRGKVNVINAAFDIADGSPPRVRGKERQSGQSAGGFRITPACAGKSSNGVMPLPSSGDHPRVCGEKLNAYKTQIETEGSPPRVRGKAFLSWRARTSTRITPACAGKSGSRRFTGLLIGITPACAGKRPGQKGEPGKDGDHPRVCGEKLGR